MEYEKSLTINEKANATLSVTIKKETLKDEYQKLLLKYTKEIALPGFRRGKVPAKIFEAKYGEVIKNDLSSNLVETTTSEIFEQLPKGETPLYYSPFVMKEMPSINFDSDFTFVISYDVYPKVEITKDEGFSIKVPTVDVTEEHIQKELEKIQERNAIFKEKDEGETVEKGNVVTIDFKVSDGEKEELNRKDYVYTLGVDNDFYGLNDDIAGMKKGEVKEITKTYPDDYEMDILRNKTKNISVTVKAIKVKNLPALDDELAQDVSSEFNTLDDLKKSLKERLTQDVALAIRAEKEELILSELIEANPIVLPESMLLYEIRSELASFFERSGLSTKSVDDYVKENKESLLQEMSPSITKKIQGALLINALKEKHSVKIEDEEFEQFLQKLADDSKMPIQNLKNMCNDQNTKASLMDRATNDKMFELLFKNCTFEEGEKLKSEGFLGVNS
ncbi:MAG: trigger factor [Treponema sp.]